MNCGTGVNLGMRTRCANVCTPTEHPMKSVVFVSFILLSSFVLFSCSKSSGTGGTGAVPGNWSQVTGLYAFNEMAEDGSVLIAAGVNGVFRSTDGGVDWTPAGTSLPAGNYNVAVIGNSVYVADNGAQGVYVSTDGGVSWKPDDSGLPGAAGSYPEITSLFSVGTNLLAGIWGGGVYRQTGPSSVWEKANSGMSTASVFAFTAMGNRILAGAENGIYISTDNGNSWVASDSGLTDSTGVGGEPSIESMTTDGTRIYAGALGGLLFVSKDGGNSWTDISANLPSSTGTGTRVAAVDTVLAVGDDSGLFLSYDGGATWTDITENVSDPVVSSIEIEGNYLYMMAANATVWRRPL